MDFLILPGLLSLIFIIVVMVKLSGIKSELTMIYAFLNKYIAKVGLSYQCPHCKFLSRFLNDFCPVCKKDINGKTLEDHQREYQDKSQSV